jgi:hypothetical protein
LLFDRRIGLLDLRERLTGVADAVKEERRGRSQPHRRHDEDGAKLRQNAGSGCEHLGRRLHEILVVIELRRIGAKARVEAAYLRQSGAGRARRDQLVAIVEAASAQTAKGLAQSARVAWNVPNFSQGRL